MIPPYDCDRVCDGLNLGGAADYWGDSGTLVIEVYVVFVLVCLNKLKMVNLKGAAPACGEVN